MRRFRLLACVPLAATLGAGLPLATPAAAATAATACQVVGSLHYSPPIDVPPNTVNVNGSLTLVCLVAPASDDGGTWSLSLTGTGSPQLCLEGVDSGVLGGSSPEGTVSGTFTIGRGYYAVFLMALTLTVGGETHTFVASGAALPDFPCPINTESLQGAGTMVDG